MLNALSKLREELEDDAIRFGPLDGRGLPFLDPSLGPAKRRICSAAPDGAQRRLVDIAKAEALDGLFQILTDESGAGRRKVEKHAGGDGSVGSYEGRPMNVLRTGQVARTGVVQPRPVWSSSTRERSFKSSPRGAACASSGPMSARCACRSTPSMTKGRP